MATVFYGTAPGRLDVMGGISDYSGALVLQMPLRESTEVEIVFTEEMLLTIQSCHGATDLGTFQIGISEFLASIEEGSRFRELFLARPHGNWAIYPAGCLAVLIKEKGFTPKNGLSITIRSSVPLGKGVSSSAAIEVATLKALSLAIGIEYKGTELAILAQKAENAFVGAPCGLMDQLASAYGLPGSALPILCQPDVLDAPISIPKGIRVFGLDSGVKHQVTGASYGQVRTAAAMGYALLAKHLGISGTQLKEARVSGNRTNLPYHGYLANIPASVFFGQFADQLPEEMWGETFLDQVGETADPYAVVDPKVRYNVRACTQHPIEEHFRTRSFRQYLQVLNRSTHPEKEIETLSLMGEAMFQSHASYGKVGLGHPRTDALVEEARRHLDRGIYGAKITGGGSGGTVCFLAAGSEGKETAIRIHRKMEEMYGELAFIDPNLD
jgi:galactokinase